MCVCVRVYLHVFVCVYTCASIQHNAGYPHVKLSTFHFNCSSISTQLLLPTVCQIIKFLHVCKCGVPSLSSSHVVFLLCPVHTWCFFSVQFTPGVPSLSSSHLVFLLCPVHTSYWFGEVSFSWGVNGSSHFSATDCEIRG